MTNAITAKDLIALLAVRHSKDVFVPECKDGPTHTARHLRMDAWTMPRSWSKPDVTAYEVKVSRSDFLGDEKWSGYLDLCNLFYFVTPPKLIFPTELPEGCGLIECTKKATRLMVKSKAPRREVDIPEEVFRYVLMARATITPPNQNGRDEREKWRQWLVQKKTDRELGWEVKGKIAELYRENVYRVDSRNRILESENSALQKAKELLAEMGIEGLHSWRLEQEIREKVEASRSGMTSDLRDKLRGSLETISDLLSELPEESP